MALLEADLATARGRAVAVAVAVAAAGTAAHITLLTASSRTAAGEVPFAIGMLISGVLLAGVGVGLLLRPAGALAQLVRDWSVWPPNDRNLHWSKAPLADGQIRRNALSSYVALAGLGTGVGGYLVVTASVVLFVLK